MRMRRQGCHRCVNPCYSSFDISVIPLAQVLKFMLGANGHIIIAPPVQDLHRSPYSVGNYVLVKLIPPVCQAFKSRRKASLTDTRKLEYDTGWNPKSPYGSGLCTNSSFVCEYHQQCRAGEMGVASRRFRQTSASLP